MLEKYRRKRNFNITREPRPKLKKRRARAPIFVIQEHHASHLHYDFRLEADGVLKSWAVPKNISLDSNEKRLAIQTEDHPFEYAKFAGKIPKGEYGAGTVKIWDHGTFENLMEEKPHPLTVAESIDAGHIEVRLHGEKIKGAFVLVRTRFRDAKNNWIVFKMKHDSMTPAQRAILKYRKKAA